MSLRPTQNDTDGVISSSAGSDRLAKVLLAGEKNNKTAALGAAPQTPVPVAAKMSAPCEGPPASVSPFGGGGARAASAPMRAGRALRNASVNYNVVDSMLGPRITAAVCEAAPAPRLVAAEPVPSVASKTATEARPEPDANLVGNLQPEASFEAALELTEAELQVADDLAKLVGSSKTLQGGDSKEQVCTSDSVNVSAPTIQKSEITPTAAAVDVVEPLVETSLQQSDESFAIVDAGVDEWEDDELDGFVFYTEEDGTAIGMRVVQIDDMVVVTCLSETSNGDIVTVSATNEDLPSHEEFKEHNFLQETIDSIINERNCAGLHVDMPSITTEAKTIVQKVSELGGQAKAKLASITPKRPSVPSVPLPSIRKLPSASAMAAAVKGRLETAFKSNVKPKNLNSQFQIIREKVVTEAGKKTYGKADVINYIAAIPRAKYYKPIASGNDDTDYVMGSMACFTKGKATPPVAVRVEAIVLSRPKSTGSSVLCVGHLMSGTSNLDYRYLGPQFHIVTAGKGIDVLLQVNGGWEAAKELSVNTFRDTWFESAKAMNDSNLLIFTKYKELLEEEEHKGKEGKFNADQSTAKKVIYDKSKVPLGAYMEAQKNLEQNGTYLYKYPAFKQEAETHVKRALTLRVNKELAPYGMDVHALNSVRVFVQALNGAPGASFIVPWLPTSYKTYLTRDVYNKEFYEFGGDYEAFAESSAYTAPEGRAVAYRLPEIVQEYQVPIALAVRIKSSTWGQSVYEQISKAFEYDELLTADAPWPTYYQEMLYRVKQASDVTASGESNDVPVEVHALRKVDNNLRDNTKTPENVKQAIREKIQLFIEDNVKKLSKSMQELTAKEQRESFKEAHLGDKSFEQLKEDVFDSKSE